MRVAYGRSSLCLPRQVCLTIVCRQDGVACLPGCRGRARSSAQPPPRIFRRRAKLGANNLHAGVFPWGASHPRGGCKLLSDSRSRVNTPGHAAAAHDLTQIGFRARAAGDQFDPQAPTTWFGLPSMCRSREAARPCIDGINYCEMIKSRLQATMSASAWTESRRLRTYFLARSTGRDTANTLTYFSTRGLGGAIAHLCSVTRPLLCGRPGLRDGY